MKGLGTCWIGNIRDGNAYDDCPLASTVWTTNHCTRRGWHRSRILSASGKCLCLDCFYPCNPVHLARANRLESNEEGRAQ